MTETAKQCFPEAELKRNAYTDDDRWKDPNTLDIENNITQVRQQDHKSKEIAMLEIISKMIVPDNGQC